MIEGRSIGEVLPKITDLDGCKVIDVGCGDGSLARHMAGLGATVIGIEPKGDQVDRARAHVPVADETFECGGAQQLPVADNTTDLVIFSNSLHHVPIDLQETALAEAARVIRPGGRVIISEPLARGPNFELCRAIEDETEVRAAAYRAIRNAASHGLEEEREAVFLRPARFAKFEDFQNSQVRVNPARARVFQARSMDLREAFERIGKMVDGKRQFDQPIRVNILRRPD